MALRELSAGVMARWVISAAALIVGCGSDTKSSRSESDSGVDLEGDASEVDATRPDAEPATQSCIEFWYGDGSPGAECTPHSTCAAGQYEVAPGTDRRDRTCAGCASGTFSASENASACQAWRDCPAGSFVTNEPSAGRDRECAPCAAGTLSKVANQSTCLAAEGCAAGTVQETPATSSQGPSCAGCEAGTHCAGGEAPKVACADGTWDHDQTAATACVPRTTCIAGERALSAGSATTDRVCEVCSQGTFSAQENAATCAAWQVCATDYVEVRAPSRTRDRSCLPAAIQFGTDGPDDATGVVTDPQNNIYVTGTVRGPLFGQAYFGGIDAYVLKYTADGAVSWTHQLGTEFDDDARDVELDAAGDLLVMGNVSGALPGAVGRGIEDAFIRKYRANGDVLWTTQLGSSRNDSGYAFASSGAASFVAGRTFGGVPGYLSAGSWDMFVAKVEANGATAWHWQLGTALSDILEAAASNASGAVWVGGHVDSGALSGQTSAGGADAVIVKLSASGVVEWQQQFGTSGYDDIAAMAVTADGELYVGGRTDGNLAGAPRGIDAYVRKYSATGATLWTAQFDWAGLDAVRKVVLGADGLIYAVGITRPPGPNGGSADVNSFVRAYDATGVERWTRQFGTSRDDDALGATVDAAGNVWVVGRTTGVFPGNTSAGFADAFLYKVVPPQ